MSELSTKPYLLRAIYDWCTDSGHTPYMAVAVDDRAVVPQEYVRQGEIVLNVSSLATSQLKIGADEVSFLARFGGKAREVRFPVESVTAIYARESGHGMAFDVPKPPAVIESSPPSLAPIPGNASPAVATSAASMTSTDSADSSPEAGAPEDPPPHRPKLVRIK